MPQSVHQISGNQSDYYSRFAENKKTDYVFLNHWNLTMFGKERNAARTIVHLQPTDETESLTAIESVTPPRCELQNDTIQKL